MFSAEELLYIYLDEILENYPEIRIEDIKSLTKLREELRIGKERLIQLIDKYLINKFGIDLAKEIKQRLWPSNTTLLKKYKIR